MEEEFIKTFGQDGVNLSCSCWYYGTSAYLFTIHVRGIEQINAQNFSFYGDIIDVNDSGLAETLKARIVPKKRQNVVLVYNIGKRQMRFRTPKSGTVINPLDGGENSWSKLLGLVGKINAENLLHSLR